MNGMMGGYFGFGWLFMLLFWVFVVAGIVWLVLAIARSQGTAGPTAESGSRALRILEERLARGEIDTEEFRTRRAAIEEGIPAHVLTAAVYERFSSRGEGTYANRVLSAMRKQFGGHVELPAQK